MDIRKLFEDTRQQAQVLTWEGTFEEYLNLLLANPATSRLAHQRIYDMIRWVGTGPGLRGVPHYALFEGELFGLETALDRVVQYFHAAAAGSEVKKRILLLVGPPGSGKSTIVNLIKRGLESYTHSSEGASYAIAGCPLQEEPLHLVPQGWRETLAQEHGWHIEGELCPRCRYVLRDEYKGDISQVRVRRFTINETEGVGIGTFVATDPGSQDISRLIGTVDHTQLTGDRVEAAGRGFRLDGELQAANRGIMEFIQMFKSDERFLTVMLGVTQEQVIKLGGFGSVYADEAVIAHSNEEEYRVFASNRQTEALLDRLILVKIPYNLRVTEEVKIYRKLLAEMEVVGVHLAPLTLRIAAVLAVLSRLEPPQRGTGITKLSLVDKLRLYDGVVVPPYTWADVETLRLEGVREGMFGISPRYVANRLADALARGRECVLPLEILQSLAEGVEERAGLTPEERERFPGLLQETMREFERMAVQEVQRASVDGFDQRAADYLSEYVRDVEALFSGKRPEERTMRRLEGALQLRDGDRPQFRQEIYQFCLDLRRRNMTPSLETLAPLKAAIENLLFPNIRELAPQLKPPQDGGQVDPRQPLKERLMADHGYCDRCADDLLSVVGAIAQGKRPATIRRGGVRWLPMLSG